MLLRAWRIWLATLSGFALLAVYWLKDHESSVSWGDELSKTIAYYLPAYLVLCLADAVICFGRAIFTSSLPDRRRFIGVGVFQLILVAVIGLTYNNLHEGVLGF